MIIGIGIPFIRRRGGGVDAQAQAHFDRVIADGGLVPSGLSGVNAFFTTVKSIYATSDITTAISVGLDAQVLGYKLGAGAGTTAGQAAQKLYSCSGASGDVVQTTAASQPLLLLHEGANYYFQSGVSANFLSSPNSVQNQITGTVDFDYCFEVQSNNSCSFGKINNNGGSPSYACFINGSNIVQYVDSGGSYRTVATITSFLPSNGNLFWVRLTLSGTTATCFTSLDGETWTSRGTATATALTVSNSATLTLSSGSMVSNSQKVYRMRIYNGLRDSGGTLVADCNPNQYNPATSQTQWTSSTGEVWTINKDTASSGFTGQLVYKTLVKFGGDAQGKSFSPNTSIQVNQPDTIYTAFNFDVFNAFQGVYDSNTTTTRQVMSNFNLSGALEVFAGALLAVSGTNQNAIRLITSIHNSTNSSIQINNGTATSGNAGTQRIDGLRIGVLANSPPSLSLKGNIFTLLISNTANNATIRTEIYNYLRSINNNAF